MLHHFVTRDQLSGLPSPILKAGKRLEEFNYRHELLALKRCVGSVEYRSYALRPALSEPLLEQLLSNLSPGDVVYDVGANVGTYSLVTASTGCRVYAFEPNPTTYRKLRQNVRLNDYNSLIETANVGLGDRNDELTFHLSSDPDRSSFNRFNAEYGVATVIDTTPINVRTLDVYMDNENFLPPDHLKIDVEGFGYEVLQGAKETIQRHEPIVYFEPHEIEDGQYQERKLRTFFSQNGYTIEKYGYPWICTPQSG